MLTFSLAALAAAVACWPGSSSRRRLRRVADRRSGPLPSHRPSGVHTASQEEPGGMPRMLRLAWPVHARRLVRPPLAVAVLAVLVGVAAGPPVAVAVVLLAAAVHRYRRGRARVRAGIEVCEETASAVRAIVADLRAGAHPVRALTTAADEATAEVGAALRGVAASARLSAPPKAATGGSAPPGTGALPEPTRDAFARLSVAWTLAAEHGIPLADVLDVLRRDLDATVAAARRTEARMAGPRASGAVLAALPLVGIALGEAMGARPLAVLTESGPGGPLLVIGTALLFAGVTWSCALTGRVMPR